MEQSTVPQPAIDRVGPWLIILAVLAGILALTWDFLVSVLTVLFDPVFLSGFALTMLQAAVASTVGGGIGVGIAELALKSKRCTQSTIRFLRLGMWLPFFVAWAAPIWWIRWGEVLQAPLWAERILRVVIAISPNVIFAGCYYHLSARYILQLNQRSALSVIASSILLQAVPFFVPRTSLSLPRRLAVVSIPRSRMDGSTRCYDSVGGRLLITSAAHHRQ